VDELVSTTPFFFPEGVWCDIFNRDNTNGCVNVTTSQNITLSSEVGEFYVNLRQGKIIPF